MRKRFDSTKRYFCSQSSKKSNPKSVKKLKTILTCFSGMASVQSQVITVKNSLGQEIHPDFTYEFINQTCSSFLWSNFLSAVQVQTEEINPSSGQGLFFTKFGPPDDYLFPSFCGFSTSDFLNNFDPNANDDQAGRGWVRSVYYEEDTAVTIDFENGDGAVLGVPSNCVLTDSTTQQIQTDELTLEWGLDEEDVLLNRINSMPNSSNVYLYSDPYEDECLGSVIVRKPEAIYWLGSQSEVTDDDAHEDFMVNSIGFYYKLCQSATLNFASADVSITAMSGQAATSTSVQAITALCSGTRTWSITETTTSGTTLTSLNGGSIPLSLDNATKPTTINIQELPTLQTGSVFTFQLTVTSSLDAAAVASYTLTLTITDLCGTATAFVPHSQDSVPSEMQSYSYVGLVSYQAKFEVDVPGCTPVFTCVTTPPLPSGDLCNFVDSAQKVLSSTAEIVSGTMPNYLKWSFNGDEVTSLATIAEIPVGTYSVTLTATFQPSSATPVTSSQSFDITFIDPCATTILAAISDTPNPLTYTIGDPTVTINVEVSDTTSRTRGDLSGVTYCGERTFALQSAQETWFTLSSDSSTGVSTISVQEASNVSLHGTTASIIVLASLTDYSAITTSISVDVQFYKSCSAAIISMPSPTLDQLTYITQNPTTTMSFVSQTASIAVDVANCGPIQVSWSMDSNGDFISEDLDSSIFSVLSDSDISIYSEDVSKVGSYTLLMSASLANYPLIASIETSVATVEIIDACTVAGGLTITPDTTEQTFPYFFDGDVISIDAQNFFFASPAVCSISYECLIVAEDGQLIDCLQSIGGGTTEASFVTGVFRFASSDINNGIFLPSNDYIVTIVARTRTALDIFAQKDFIVTFVDIVEETEVKEVEEPVVEEVESTSDTSSIETQTLLDISNSLTKEAPEAIKPIAPMYQVYTNETRYLSFIFSEKEALIDVGETELKGLKIRIVSNSVPDAVQVSQIDYPKDGLASLLLEVGAQAEDREKDEGEAATRDSFKGEVIVEVQDLSIGGKTSTFTLNFEFLDGSSQDQPPQTIEIQEDSNQKNETQPMFKAINAVFKPKSVAEEDEKVKIEPVIREIDQTGFVYIDFKPKIASVPNDWHQLWSLEERSKMGLEQRAKYEEELKKIMHVQFVQNSEEMPQTYLMSNLTSFNSHGIHINLNFSDPMLVSQGENADAIKIRLLKSYFLSPDSKLAQGHTRSLASASQISEEDDYFVIEHKLPPQFENPAEAVVLTKTAETVRDVLVTSFALTFILSLLLNNIMAQMWSTFNTLQILIALPMMAVFLPANLVLVQQIVYDIVNFQIIDKGILQETIVEPIFGETNIMQDLKISKDAFAQESLLLQVLQLLLVLSAAGLFLGIMRCCKAKIISRCCLCFKKFMTVFMTNLVISSLLQASMQTYLQTCFSTWFSFKNTNLDTPLGRVDLFLCILMLFFTNGFMTFTHKFLRRNKDKLREPSFKATYESIYQSVDYYKDVALKNTSFFLLRRSLFAAVIVFCSYSIVLQVFLADILSTCMLGYFLVARPMSKASDNLMQGFNEIVVLLCVWTMLQFSNYVPSPGTRYQLAYYFLYTIGVNIVINIVYLAVTILKSLQSACKNYFARRRAKKAMQANIMSQTKIVDENSKVNSTLLFIKQEAELQSQSLQLADSLKADKAVAGQEANQDQKDDSPNDRKRQPRRPRLIPKELSNAKMKQENQNTEEDKESPENLQEPFAANNSKFINADGKLNLSEIQREYFVEISLNSSLSSPSRKVEQKHLTATKVPCRDSSLNSSLAKSALGSEHKQQFVFERAKDSQEIPESSYGSPSVLGRISLDSQLKALRPMALESDKQSMSLEGSEPDTPLDFHKWV